MYAIRELQTVQNGQVTVHIPADFPTDQVEVIVLPAPAMNGAKNGVISANPQRMSAGLQAIQNILCMDINHLSPEQQLAYQRTAQLLRDWLQTGKKPQPGLFTGLIEVTDDFDAPLPDEIVDLFYGSETDAYGMSLPR